MKRFTISALTAFAVAIAAPAPVRADLSEADIAKIIAGLAAVLVIGNALDDDNSSANKRSAVGRQNSNNTVRRPQFGLGGESLIHDRILPGQCFRILDSASGSRRVFGKRCLERNYRHAASLPRFCETRVNTNRGLRTVYLSSCLRNEGYRLASR